MQYVVRVQLNQLVDKANQASYRYEYNDKHSRSNQVFLVIF